MTTFDLDKIPSTITAVSLVKKRPKAQNEDGRVVKKITLRLDVYDAERLERCETLFPGCVALAKAISGAEGAGLKQRAKQKMGPVIVKVYDTQGEELFTTQNAEAGQPELEITREAKETWLKFSFEVDLGKDKARVVEEYFRAETLTSAANAQLELDAPRKPATTRRKKAPPPPTGETDAEFRARLASGVSPTQTAGDA